MKPINAEEIVRVFNGWLEEADSLAEREAIECCIDHIQDAPAVSQQISIHALREEGDSKNRDKISIFKQIIQHSARI